MNKSTSVPLLRISILGITIFRIGTGLSGCGGGSSFQGGGKGQGIGQGFELSHGGVHGLVKRGEG